MSGSNFVAPTDSKMEADAASMDDVDAGAVGGLIQERVNLLRESITWHMFWDFQRVGITELTRSYNLARQAGASSGCVQTPRFEITEPTRPYSLARRAGASSGCVQTPAFQGTSQDAAANKKSKTNIPVTNTSRPFQECISEDTDVDNHDPPVGWFDGYLPGHEPREQGTDISILSEREFNQHVQYCRFVGQEHNQSPRSTLCAPSGSYYSSGQVNSGASTSHNYEFGRSSLYRSMSENAGGTNSFTDAVPGLEVIVSGSHGVTEAIQEAGAYILD